MPTHPFRRAVAFAATTAAVCALALSSATAASAAIVPSPITDSVTNAALGLSPIGTFESGVYKESAAEIVQTYRDRIFVVNAQAGTVGVLDNSDPTNPTELFEIASTGTANSVAIRDDGLGVIAFEAPVKTDPGHVVFFDANATSGTAAVLGELTVGALPDMVTISKDGAYAVVANEAEPSDDFTVDPEGSVSVIALPTGIALPAAVKTANFRAFESAANGGTKTLDPKVRVFGPDVAAPDQGTTPLAGNRVSRNLEPEYITTSGTTAYVGLQEANAIAVIDLTKPEVTSILPLGYKDYGVAANALDASDKDGVGLEAYPGLKGLYMPDGLQSYQATVAGAAATYLVTANEGDAREWGDFIDEARVKSLDICATSPLAALKADDALGRLKVVSDLGKTDAGCYNDLYSYGGRSFSIWDTKGQLVFDSGDDFEQKLREVAPAYFNVSNDNNTVDDRSDDKGPEPEAIAVGVVDGRTYAFIGLERVGGVMVYDITDPKNSTYVTYVNNRDVTKDVETPAAGDLGPEGIAFVSATRSQTGTPYLVVGNEVSGTTTTYDVEALLETQPDVQVLTINDFHGRLVQETGGVAGAAVLAGAVDKYRQINPNTLFVSAGDNIGATAFESFLSNDDPTVDALKTARLDLSAVGNHEFDKGFADLQERLTETGTGNYGNPDFGLGANVYQKGTKTPALKEYAIREVNGVKIAFIGTVTADTATLVNPDGIADIEFGDPTEAANRVSAKIEAENLADITILLTHDGFVDSNCDVTASEAASAFGKTVSQASADIDAIVSAHTHQTYPCALPGPTGENRPVIQANQYGTTLGTLDIELTDAGALESITPGVVPLLEPVTTSYIAYSQAETAKVVSDAKAIAAVKGAEEVGTITADILRAKTETGAEDRGSHSTLGNTVADVYLWATSENPDFGGTDAEIAFMNPGGLRADLLFGSDNGSVSYREAANVQPFGNTLVTLELTPAQIKGVLEEQWQPAGASRPKLALGVSKGFTFEYDPAAAKGSNIVSMQLNGKELLPSDKTLPIDNTTKIRIVTNSFLAAGGDAFATFKAGTSLADSGQIDLQASVDYFDAKGSVSPSPANRAYLIGEEPPVEEPGTEEPTNPEPTNPTPTIPPTPVDPGGTPPAVGTQVGGDWADVSLSNGGRVEQGGSLKVTVSGLEPGQQIAATLFSDPIAVSGIPAANAAGTTTFSIAIPADFDLGAHRLVVTAAGVEPISVGVMVTAPGALAATGSEMPYGIALGAGFLLVAGGLVFALRKRRTVS
ncbi:choice-of-anchor I family protein [Microbacterium sp. P07]|uniref:choice-of-anchor I family protein n=1 Tax=Microbacterium sp. P07 TaxID=3366952 RepID=UPI003745E368